jgi:hypothetical protein
MATLRERIQADIESIEAQISAARTALLNITTSEVDKGDMENLDTRQRFEHLGIEDLEKMIRRLEIDRDKKYDLLNGPRRAGSSRLRR